MTSGVIQTPPLALVPGSTEPMKPVRVKTVQVRSGQMKLASAGPTRAIRHHRIPYPCRRPEPRPTDRRQLPSVEPAEQDYAPPAMRTECRG